MVFMKVSWEIRVYGVGCDSFYVDSLGSRFIFGICGGRFSRRSLEKGRDGFGYGFGCYVVIRVGFLFRLVCSIFLVI